MALYLRKSFKKGPVKLNLSKSGLGVSAGVKGARLGINSKGRSYAHAGVGGIYYRKSLGGSKHRRSSPETNTEFVDTEETFESEIPLIADDNSLPERHKKSIFIYLLIPLAGFLLAGLIQANKQSLISSPGLETMLNSISVIAILIWPLPMIIAFAMNLKGYYVGKRLDKLVSSNNLISEDELVAIVSSRLLSRKDRSYYTCIAYFNKVKAIVSDGRVTTEELMQLDKLMKAFSLDENYSKQAKADGFRTAYLEYVSDMDLSEDEESSLSHIREKLGIKLEDIQEELSFVDTLKEVRNIRNGELSEIIPSFNIQKSENCYFEGEGKILKKKILRSYTRDGVKHKIEGLVPDKDGIVLITNKRLLLVHDGTTSIRLEKILDIDVNLDNSLLSITKDGMQKPVYITAPNILLLSATLQAVVDKDLEDGF